MSDSTGTQQPEPGTWALGHTPEADQQRLHHLVEGIVEEAREHGEVSSKILTMAIEERLAREPNWFSRTVTASGPPTAIQEDIRRAAWVIERLVACHGFQCSLTVYGGDYEEYGTATNREVRINIVRESFTNEMLRTLTEFAPNHGCELEISQKHGATLRLLYSHWPDGSLQREGTDVEGLDTPDRGPGAPRKDLS